MARTLQRLPEVACTSARAPHAAGRGRERPPMRPIAPETEPQHPCRPITGLTAGEPKTKSHEVSGGELGAGARGNSGIGRAMGCMSVRRDFDFPSGLTVGPRSTPPGSRSRLSVRPRSASGGVRSVAAGCRAVQPDGKSRASREVHARFCERLGVRLPGATRPPGRVEVTAPCACAARRVQRRRWRRPTPRARPCRPGSRTAPEDSRRIDHPGSTP